MASAAKLKTNVAKKILVVEDEGQIGLVLNMILSDRDCEFDYVNNLLDAEEYLEQNKPAVIIFKWFFRILHYREIKQKNHRNA